MGKFRELPCTFFSFTDRPMKLMINDTMYDADWHRLLFFQQWLLTRRQTWRTKRQRTSGQNGKDVPQRDDSLWRHCQPLLQLSRGTKVFPIPVFSPIDTVRCVYNCLYVPSEDWAVCMSRCTGPREGRSGESSHNVNGQRTPSQRPDLSESKIDDNTRPQALFIKMSCI